MAEVAAVAGLEAQPEATAASEEGQQGRQVAGREEVATGVVAVAEEAWVREGWEAVDVEVVATVEEAEAVAAVVVVGTVEAEAEGR